MYYYVIIALYYHEVFYFCSLSDSSTFPRSSSTGHESHVKSFSYANAAAGRGQVTGMSGQMPKSRLAPIFNLTEEKGKQLLPSLHESPSQKKRSKSRHGKSVA